MFGRLRFLRVTPSNGQLAWTSKDISHISPQNAEKWFVDGSGKRTDWQWAVVTLRFGPERFESYTFPYWLVVIPLVLVSARLLIGGPRSKLPPLARELAIPDA
jgi:hypothetical protein